MKKLENPQTASLPNHFPGTGGKIKGDRTNKTKV